MVLKLILILLLIFLGNHSNAQSKDELQDKIAHLLNEQKLSGAVWATVLDNGAIAIDSYGYKNGITKETLNPTDKVQVGSVCKTILAAGFLRMATVGLLNLDDPVKKYLPNLPLEYHDYTHTPITIRQLLDHTSGLPDAKLWHVFSTTAAPDTPLEAAYINSPHLLKVQTKPGSIYSYSNIGYTILGMILQKITNKRYEEYLAESLLKPLRMHNSSFKFISQTKDKKLAYGHFDTEVPVDAMPMYLRPAGQFTTTAEDVGIFLKFIMSDGTIDGKPFIDSHYLNAVGKQQRTDAYKHGIPFGDALGAYSRDRYGVVGIAKNGNTLGFSSMIYMFPERKKAFFIAFNMDSETANYDLFNEILIEHLGLATHNFIKSEQEIERDIQDWNGYYVPILTKVQPFHLLDLVFSRTKVETSKSGASLIPFQGSKRELIYQGNHLFSTRDRTNISHAFYTATDGTLLITNGVSTLKKVDSSKIGSVK
jgi:CubicO group peptidase (beta-lactamase class C family)